MTQLYCWGFHEKGTPSYLSALGKDRKSPLNECTLQVPFYMKSIVYPAVLSFIAVSYTILSISDCNICNMMPLAS